MMSVIVKSGLKADVEFPAEFDPKPKSGLFHREPSSLTTYPRYGVLQMKFDVTFVSS